MPVAAARSRAVRVFLSAEKASIRARTRRAPSHPCTALASGGILTAVALAMMTLLGKLERNYRGMITTSMYTVNVSTKNVRHNREIAGMAMSLVRGHGQRALKRCGPRRHGADW